MATYVIGDIQGCFFTLQTLLATLDFSASRDTLWFTGDLINRGRHSLKTARFIQSLDNSALFVLGNHELTLLATGFGAISYHPKHTFLDILEAPDKNNLLEWMRSKPLAYLNGHQFLAHAGLYPLWSPEKAVQLSVEVEHALQGPDALSYLTKLYGDHPNIWEESLTGTDRLRFITNALTRMRYCTPAGHLNLKVKDAVAPQADGSVPWFDIPNESRADHHILFGHWAALKGQCSASNIYALDTGCIWNNTLTAMNIASLERISVSCDRKDQLS